MDEIGELVFKTAKSLFQDIDIVICGSYRRGKTSSGDIDFLLSPKTDDHIPNANTTSLALSSINHYGVSTYMGICKLSKDDSIHRRIDIKYYPKKLFPFALLYFTGSDHFNRSMRLYASKQGYSLNDKVITLTLYLI
eukprot:gene20141-26150_t